MAAGSYIPHEEGRLGVQIEDLSCGHRLEPFSHPGFTTPGYMGIKVSLGQKKLKIFLKLRPSEIFHFEGMVSGNSNTFLIKHDIASWGL